MYIPLLPFIAEVAVVEEQRFLNKLIFTNCKIITTKTAKIFKINTIFNNKITIITIYTKTVLLRTTLYTTS